MRFINYLVFTMCLYSCTKTVIDKKTNIIGHAAMGLNSSSSIYADNSMEAIQLALSFTKCKGVELDVQMDNLGQLWLYHDENLSAKTNTDGCINSIDPDVLSTVFYKTIHHEKLVKLDQDLLEVLKDKIVFFDLRHFNPCTNSIIESTKIKNALLAVEVDSVENVIIISSNYELLQTLADEFKVFYATDNYAQGLQIMLDYPECDGLVIRNVSITADEVHAIQKLNKQVAIFEVRSPKGTKIAFNKAPDYLITDELRTALSIAHQ
jgi:glycerophosphoryl diester phosphodiesterase